MVNEGGNGRKKNRARNKKKNKNQQNTGLTPTNLTEEPTEFVPPPVAAPIVSPPSEDIPEITKPNSSKRVAQKAEEKREYDLAKNLIRDEDFVAKGYSLSSLQDAEASFYSYMEKSAAKQSGSDEELDLFASDDEVVEKPKMVKPTPKRKGPKTTSDGKSSTVKKTTEASEASISTTSSNSSSLSAEIARARQHIKSSLEYVDGLAALAGGSDVSGKIAKLESDNAKLHKAVNDLKNVVLTLQDKVAVLEKTCGGSSAPTCGAPKKTVEEEDDDVDLFGSESDEEEDAEKVRIREERLKAYHEKKSKKPALIAKTSVLLDVKPWDDDTDMDAMLAACKTIKKEGLVWGASKLVPIGYGINKLQVMCVVEDEKVSIDELSEQIEAFEDFVQSVDVAAMSKI